jgi:hypothetical protein
MVESDTVVTCRISGGLHIQQKIWGRILLRESFNHIRKCRVLLSQPAAPIFFKRLANAAVC